ncbi:uncharacterized protein EV422DRAFT_542722 [Fimicolochytrium jonesii]|uniref:uncharacterized protein n=1 Tax=Fimicolochytrium jonesii TaxID=1396493 RepID=UPI0022FF18AB|nr:uncharacterized protein EV422DRAFT_542722 [Fimicolochytrium jonesii]KAI8817170.1 hypothetical protein EV422DRAFT_542722 [Fimicolochytrium jonesii]
MPSCKSVVCRRSTTASTFATFATTPVRGRQQPCLGARRASSIAAPPSSESKELLKEDQPQTRGTAESRGRVMPVDVKTPRTNAARNHLPSQKRPYLFTKGSQLGRQLVAEMETKREGKAAEQTLLPQSRGRLRPEIMIPERRPPHLFKANTIKASLLDQMRIDGSNNRRNRPHHHEWDADLAPQPPSKDPTAISKATDFTARLTDPKYPPLSTDELVSWTREKTDWLRNLSPETVHTVFTELKSRKATRQLRIEDWHRLMQHMLARTPFTQRNPASYPARAVAVLKEIKHCSITPDPLMYAFIFRAMKDHEKKIEEMHRFLFVDNRATPPALDSYSGKCWRTILAVYLRRPTAHRLLTEARDLWRLLRQAGIQPDKLTCHAFLEAFASQRLTERVKVARDPKGVAEVHNFMQFTASERKLDPVSADAVMAAHDACGNDKSVVNMFEARTERERVKLGVVAYTTAIRAAHRLGKHNMVLRLYLQMQREGITPNDDCFGFAALALAHYPHPGHEIRETVYEPLGRVVQQRREMTRGEGENRQDPAVAAYTKVSSKSYEMLIEALQKSRDWQLALRAYQELKALREVEFAASALQHSSSTPRSSTPAHESQPPPHHSPRNHPLTSRTTLHHVLHCLGHNGRSIEAREFLLTHVASAERLTAYWTRIVNGKLKAARVRSERERPGLEATLQTAVLELEAYEKQASAITHDDDKGDATPKQQKAKRKGGQQVTQRYHNNLHYTVHTTRLALTSLATALTHPIPELLAGSAGPLRLAYTGFVEGWRGWAVSLGGEQTIADKAKKERMVAEAFLEMEEMVRGVWEVEMGLVREVVRGLGVEVEWVPGRVEDGGGVVGMDEPATKGAEVGEWDETSEWGLRSGQDAAADGERASATAGPAHESDDAGMAVQSGGEDISVTEATEAQDETSDVRSVTRRADPTAATTSETNPAFVVADSTHEAVSAPVTQDVDLGRIEAEAAGIESDPSPATPLDETTTQEASPAVASRRAHLGYF